MVTQDNLKQTYTCDNCKFLVKKMEYCQLYKRAVYKTYPINDTETAYRPCIECTLHNAFVENERKDREDMISFMKDRIVIPRDVDNIEITSEGVKALLMNVLRNAYGIEIDSIDDIKFTKNISHPALDTKEHDYEFDKCKIKISKKVI